MRIHVTSDVEIRDYVRKGLRENDNYCPCVLNSKGNIDYKCPCKDFRENTQVGEICYCGLYVKDEM